MSERREFRDLAAPEELRTAIDSLDLDGGIEDVPLREARGRVLAERVDAAIDVPGFDRAAMDGYAVRAGDTAGATESDPVALTVAGTVAAGEDPDCQVEAGVAVEVGTGAVLPAGADAVVMVEQTDRSGERVAIRSAAAPGQHVMAAGADVAAGDRALGPDAVVSSREVGLLAALGVATVTVRAPPTVGVVSTGAELIPPGDSLDDAAGQIHDVNGPALGAAVEAAGGRVRRYDRVPDDEAAIEERLRDAADECDLLLTSGSTSASAGDVVYRVLENRGELLLHGVAVKPGKPTVVGRFEGVPFVGLPGYPVSAQSVFRSFLAPAVARAAGRPAPERAAVAAEMAVRERFAEGRRRLLPVGLVGDGDGATLAYPVDRGSGATTSLADADGVVSVPATTDYVSPGECVDVELFAAGSRRPRLLVVGERDPSLWDYLDRVERPRALARGARGGARWLEDGVADVGVLAGPTSVDAAVEQLGAWQREWGLVLPPGNPAGVEGIAALVDRQLRFANRDRAAGLRGCLDAAVDDLAARRGEDTAALTAAIDGYGLETRGLESPARRVARGSSDAGLALRSTAERHDLGFCSLGTDEVRVLAAVERADKPGVADLRAVLPPGPEA